MTIRTFKLLTIGTLLFIGASNVCAQNKLEGIVDTNYKNATAAITMEESDDCAVRAISEAYNITYRQSHVVLKSWGRINNEGVYWKLIEEGIDRDFPLTAFKLVPVSSEMNSFAFVDKIAESGYTYIIVADKHVFVIEEEYYQHWLVKGNLNDATKQILGYMKINI